MIVLRAITNLNDPELASIGKPNPRERWCAVEVEQACAAEQHCNNDRENDFAFHTVAAGYEAASMINGVRRVSRGNSRGYRMRADAQCEADFQSAWADVRELRGTVTMHVTRVEGQRQTASLPHIADRLVRQRKGAQSSSGVATAACLRS
jgi:hypothetical protein